jgi:hypothetical protein
MNIELNQDDLCMKSKQLLRVRGGIGHSIACHSGSVWVTQDGDPRDVILRAGESFTLDRPGPALVQAFQPGAISIVRPEAQSIAARLVAILRPAVPVAAPRRGAFGI